MTLPREVEIAKDILVNDYDCDFNDPDCVNECVTDYLSDNYDFCVNSYNGWEIKDDIVWVFDIEWDDDYEDYIDELNDLDLDDTAFEYYASMITDMHYGDNISQKNGEVGYDSYEDILDDARKTAGQSQFDDED